MASGLSDHVWTIKELIQQAGESLMQRFTIWLSVMFSATSAHGIVLYSQIPTTTYFGGFDSIDQFRHTADNFTATENWLLQSVTFQGTWLPGMGIIGWNDTSRKFRIELYNEFLGGPGNQLRRIGATATLTNPNLIQDVLAYDVRFDIPPNVAPVLLSAGSTYWLAIIDEDNHTNNDGGFYWRIAWPGDYRVAQRFRASYPWFFQTGQGDANFTLLGEVIPEPSTLLLLSAALPFFSIRRRKSQKGQNGLQVLPADVPI